MKFITKIVLVLFLIYFHAFSLIKNADVYHEAMSHSCWPSHIDTIYLNAGLLALDSDKDIKIIKDGMTYLYPDEDPVYRDELCFMDPNNKDSAIMIFDTSLINYPDTVTIGSYPEGTELIFRFRVIKTFTYTETQYKNEDGSFKKYYTGQNRDSIDLYISDETGVSVSASAMINDSIVGTAFDPHHGTFFGHMYIKTVNAQMTGLDVFKISRPKISDAVDTSFSDSVSLELYIPYKGNFLQIVEEWINPVDTIDHRPDSTDFQIFYTTDGSDPSDTANAQLYNDEPIVIKETSTLKAVGVLPYQPDSTTWYPSEVVEWKFTDETSSNNSDPDDTGFRLDYKIEDRFKEKRVYDIKGRLLKKVKKDYDIRDMVDGIYVTEYVTDKGIVRKVILN